MEAASPLPAPIRIAIADDEPLFVEMVSALLASEEGLEVVATAGNGRRAVEVAAEYEPDVILMDISMPVMDGIEATRQIRARNGDACVLILTGATTPEDVDRARQAGAAAYVTKDRIATDLVAEIRNLAAN